MQAIPHVPVRTISAEPAAVLVPESAAAFFCTVMWWIHVLVVVSVKRAEHHAVLPAELITGVTRVPRHLQSVVVRLWLDYERTVLGVVPFAVVT